MPATSSGRAGRRTCSSAGRRLRSAASPTRTSSGGSMSSLELEAAKRRAPPAFRRRRLVEGSMAFPHALQRVLHRSAPLANEALRLLFGQLRLVALRRTECPRDLVLRSEAADGEACERSRADRRRL